MGHSHMTYASVIEGKPPTQNLNFKWQICKIILNTLNTMLNKINKSKEQNVTSSM